MHRFNLRVRRVLANFATAKFPVCAGLSAQPLLACKEHAGWGFGANYIAQQIVPRGGETIFVAAILISSYN
jgi:hypothetical protein